MTLKLNGSTSGYTAIDAPAAAGSNTLVLPTTNGSADQVLKTDGSGNLSWTTPGAGKVLQWVSGRYTNDREQTTDTSNFVAMPDGLSITPTATSSRILMMVTLSINKDHNNTTKLDFARTISGGSTTLSLSGASDGLTSWGTPNGFITLNMSWVDHPNTTTSTLYQVCIKAGGGTVHLNDFDENSGSSMTLLELAG